MADHDGLHRVLDALDRAGVQRKEQKDGSWRARCPVHEGTSADSLSVQHHQPTTRDAGGRARIRCFGGCDELQVLDLLGLTLADLYDDPIPAGGRGVVREFPYLNGAGQLLGVVQRREPKTFRPLTIHNGQWRQKASDDLQGTPYRLPGVVVAIEKGEPVWVVEGERDADSLAQLGITATCNAGGAGKWSERHARWLTGAHVTVCADADQKGRDHAAAVVASLRGIAASVRLVEPAEGYKDISDHLAAGKTVHDVVEQTVASECEPRRRIELVPVAEVKMRRPQWLWDQRVPLGELTLAVGRAGIGKSMNTVWLASQVTRGQLSGEHRGVPKPVLYLATEDSWDHTVAPRFVAAGADLGRVFAVQVLGEDDRETSLSLAIDLDELRRKVRESGAVLVVIDALLSTMTGADMYKATDVRRLLEPLARLAHDLDVAVLGVAHFRKSAGADPLTMVAGSTAFGDVIRSAIGFARDEGADDGSCVLSPIKSNMADPAGAPSLRYRIESTPVDIPGEGTAYIGRYVELGEASTSVHQLLRDSDEPDDRSERDDAVNWLLGYLADKDGRAPAADVLKAAERDGITKTTLHRARKRAGVTTAKCGMGGGWTWQTPEGSTEESEDSQPRQEEPSEPSRNLRGDEDDPATARALHLLHTELGATPLPPTGTEHAP